jgi:zinc/manganese transport system substrate-binding protein
MAVVVFFLLLVTGAVFAAGPSGAVLNIVAAENFYGNIVQQVGGAQVRVMSILSDPNVDPHEYESSVDDAKAVANADLVIENGGGYDDWMDKLLAAAPNAKRVLLKGFDLAATRLPDNEHVWYSLDNGEAIAQVVADNLTRLSPGDAATFEKNLKAFRQSLTAVRRKMAQIKTRWGGTPVGLTETIFLYQAQPLGLSVLTPFEFQKAVARG